MPAPLPLDNSIMGPSFHPGGRRLSNSSSTLRTAAYCPGSIAAALAKDASGDGGTFDFLGEESSISRNERRMSWGVDATNQHGRADFIHSS